MHPMKRCSGPCGRDLPVEDFQKDASQTSGRKSRCKTCSNDAREDRRERARKANAPCPAPFELDPERWPNLLQFDIERTLDKRPNEVEIIVSNLAAPDEPAAKPEPRIEIVEETITQVEEHRLKAKVRDLTAELKALTRDLSDANLMADLVREAREHSDNVTPIEPRERRSGLLEGTVQVLASDWHVEEEVKPEQVAGRNRYNLEISEARMTRFFEATRWGIDFNRQAFKIRDLILWLGGDLITNYLHPDNVETNLLAPQEAIAYVFTNIVAGIRHLLLDPELERIVVPCNDGNHGRLTEKMRAASRVENSIETLLYTMLAQEFRGEPRVQFIIARGSQLFYEVYGRTIRYTHGDTTKYGGGVGGITIPIYKAIARWQTVRHADLTVMGHYHQRTNLKDLIINGSLIGYGPYSMSIGARFEPPVQDLTVFDPRRWKSVSMPLWVSELSDDQLNDAA